MGLAMRTLSELYPLILPSFWGKIVVCSGRARGERGGFDRLSADFLGILWWVQHGSKL
jgi:hypothetical protein